MDMTRFTSVSKYLELKPALRRGGEVEEVVEEVEEGVEGVD